MDTDTTSIAHGWWDESDGPRYDTIGGGVIKPEGAAIVDAGNNVLARSPASKWRTLARAYSRQLREGRVNLIGFFADEAQP